MMSKSISTKHRMNGYLPLKDWEEIINCFQMLGPKPSKEAVKEVFDDWIFGSPYAEQQRNVGALTVDRTLNDTFPMEVIGNTTGMEQAPRIIEQLDNAGIEKLRLYPRLNAKRDFEPFTFVTAAQSEAFYTDGIIESDSDSNLLQEGNIRVSLPGQWRWFVRKNNQSGQTTADIAHFYIPEKSLPTKQELAKPPVYERKIGSRNQYYTAHTNPKVR